MRQHINAIMEIEKVVKENGGKVRPVVEAYMNKHGLTIRVATRGDSRHHDDECFKAHHGTWYRLMYQNGKGEQVKTDAVNDLKTQVANLTKMTESARRNIDQVVNRMFDAEQLRERRQMYKLVETCKQYHEAQAKLRRGYGETQDAAYHEDRVNRLSMVLALADESNVATEGK